MVMEHERIGQLSIKKQAEIEAMIQYNLRKSTESNRFVPLALLQLAPGFKLDIADGTRYEVKKMFKNGQVLVTKDDLEQPTMAIWERTKLVRVPKDLI